MHKLLLSGLCLLASTANTAPVVAPNGNAYEYIPSVGITWLDADAAASSSIYDGTGGHLVSISNQEENYFVLSLLNDVTGSVWLGGSDAAQEGQWKWISDNGDQFWQGGVDGSAIGYANWVPNYEPNDEANEDYVGMFGGAVEATSQWAPGLWNDFSFNQAGEHPTHSMYSMVGYVVEYNIVPIPAAAWLFGSGLIGLIGLARRKA